MKITKEQYQALCEAKCWSDDREFHDLLKNITGIEAKRFTGYQYFDSSGNYLGDISMYDCGGIRDILDNAYIEIEE